MIINVCTKRQEEDLNYLLNLVRMKLEVLMEKTGDDEVIENSVIQELLVQATLTGMKLAYNGNTPAEVYSRMSKNGTIPK